MDVDQPKVVSIFGADAPVPHEPIQSVIDLCRETLAKAERGTLRGVVVVQVDDATGLGTWYTGEAGTSATLLAGVALAQFQLSYELASHAINIQGDK